MKFETPRGGKIHIFIFPPQEDPNNNLNISDLVHLHSGIPDFNGDVPFQITMYDGPGNSMTEAPWLTELPDDYKAFFTNLRLPAQRHQVVFISGFDPSKSTPMVELGDAPVTKREDLFTIMYAAGDVPVELALTQVVKEKGPENDPKAPDTVEGIPLNTGWYIIEHFEDKNKHKKTTDRTKPAKKSRSKSTRSTKKGRPKPNE